MVTKKMLTLRELIVEIISFELTLREVIDLPESPLSRGIELFLTFAFIKSIELSRRRALTATSGATSQGHQRA